MPRYFMILEKSHLYINFIKYIVNILNYGTFESCDKF